MEEKLFRERLTNTDHLPLKKKENNNWINNQRDTNKLV